MSGRSKGEPRQSIWSRRTEARPGDRSFRYSAPIPIVASFGYRGAIPLGVLIHLATVVYLLDTSIWFEAPPTPSPPTLPLRLMAPPAAAERFGDPTAIADPELQPSDSPRPVRRTMRALRAELLAALDRVPEPTLSTFGFETGIFEGLWGGMPGGLPEGVIGGLIRGTPGGTIGGLPTDADPQLLPPDEPPVPITMPRPRFPTAALRDGVRGSVVLRALITQQGTVEVLRILRSVPGLDAEAVRVVESEWRFRPAQRNGRPTPTLSDLVVRFTIR